MQATCEHCGKNIKVDEASLAGGSGFVRCPHCAKVTATEGASGAQEVSCDSCGTHYAIAKEKFSAPRISVKCAKCGNHFEVTAAGASADSDLAQDPLDLDDSELGDAELSEDFGDDLGDDAMDLNGDGLSDLDEEDDFASLDDDFTGGIEPEGEAEPEDDFASLDAGLDDSDMAEPSADFDLGEDEPDFDSGLPDEPDLEGLEEAEEFGEMEDEITAEERNLFLGSELAETGPALSSKKTKRKKGSRAPFWSFMGLLMVVGLVAGGLYLNKNPQFLLEQDWVQIPQGLLESKPQVMLSLQTPLKGRWVENRQVGRIFVLEGQIKNYYPADRPVHWIQITGMLQGVDGEPMAKAHNLAGRALKDIRLSQWNRVKLEAYAKLDPTAAPSLNTEALIPFQILFFDVNAPIGQLVAEISGLSAGDEAH
ncbi:MAG: zinc-ribbon domain-containing protein [bacterium]|nr:zinc-ribbon domain-containing protein [bacterium]